MSSLIWAEDGPKLTDAHAKAREANEILESIVEFTTQGCVKNVDNCDWCLKVELIQTFSQRRTHACLHRQMTTNEFLSRWSFLLHYEGLV